MHFYKSNSSKSSKTFQTRSYQFYQIEKLSGFKNNLKITRHTKKKKKKKLLQVRLELTTPASLTSILSYKYRALTNCATGATGKKVFKRRWVRTQTIFYNDHQAIVYCLKRKFFYAFFPHANSFAQPCMCARETAF